MLRSGGHQQKKRRRRRRFVASLLFDFKQFRFTIVALMYPTSITMLYEERSVMS
jgi:hypothetical protein